MIPLKGAGEPDGVGGVVEEDTAPRDPAFETAQGVAEWASTLFYRKFLQAIVDIVHTDGLGRLPIGFAAAGVNFQKLFGESVGVVECVGEFLEAGDAEVFLDGGEVRASVFAELLARLVFPAVREQVHEAIQEAKRESAEDVAGEGSSAGAHGAFEKKIDEEPSERVQCKDHQGSAGNLTGGDFGLDFA